jgi:transcriptional regulator with XRE-family HTH domain
MVTAVTNNVNSRVSRLTESAYIASAVKELGRKVRARRNKLGLKQTQLAERVGRTHGWLSALENGKGGDTPAEVITALAVELGEDPSDYLRAAGRTVLRAEDVMPAPPLDPRITKAIDDAFERMADRLIAFLDERLPGSGPQGAP